MSPAEFKTLREYLGLTITWVAERAGVGVRTVQYWESGRSKVPADVINMLTALDSNAERAVSEALKLAMAMTADQRPERIVLLRYLTDADLHRYRPDMTGLPTTAHAALLARVQRALWALGLQVSIEYMQPEAYETWLDGRSDNEAMRAAWAASKT